MWEIAQYTDRGSRLTNEDRISVEEMGALLCVTIADGVGGHGGGSTAATIVTKKMAEMFRTMWGSREKDPGDDTPAFCKEDIREKMASALEEVNQTVVSMQTAGCPMQATCVTLWLEQRKDGGCNAVWAHVGDSRLYLFVDNKLIMRTKDHSLAELWKYDPDIKKRHVARNAIWQAMGETGGLKPDISKLETLSGRKTAFLLCSDGLWECVGENRIARALRGSKTPEEWLEKLRVQMKGQEPQKYDNNTAAAVFIT